MKFMLIGGGENGRPGKPYETKLFDETIVKMAKNSKNTQKRLLFIGFAQKNTEFAASYFNVISSNFTKLGCMVENLNESDLQNKKLCEQKVFSADIIYVGGGNTLRLMTMFRKYGLNSLLYTAGQNGCVLCGVSAGAICWCAHGNSDSRKFTSNSTKLIKVTGLNFINALFCPHYDVEVARQEDLKRMMKRQKGVALAFENCTALKIDGQHFEVLKARPSASAYKCYYKSGEYTIVPLKLQGKLEEILKKD